MNKKEFAWLKLIAETVCGCGAKQPITIGTMNGQVARTGNIETFVPLVDVLCVHPYAHDREGLEKLITAYQALRQSHARPLLVNECIPGSLNDATRGEVARSYTGLLAAADFGWMGWALREGKAISTRRDRYDSLEFLTEKPKLRAPWEKA